MPAVAALGGRVPAASPQVDSPPTGFFNRNSRRHSEFVADSGVNALGANAVYLGPFDVPARGFLRAIWLNVISTGGTLGAGALAADFPFNQLARVTLTDVGGQNIVDLPGYSLALANIFGGYSFFTDPRDDDTYVSTINSNFVVRIPLEIRSDGLGALPNLDSAATYKLKISLADTGTVYSTAPTTPASVQVLAYAEEWERPKNASGPTEPPGVGTTQFWETRTYNINAGANTIRLTRVGNLIRNLILVYRTTAAGLPRSDAFPSELQFRIESVDSFTDTLTYRRNLIRRIFNVPRTTGTPTLVGSLVYPFHDGSSGHADRGDDGDLWLPTLQSSRLEVQGTWAAGGTLEVITNDVVLAQ